MVDQEAKITLLIAMNEAINEDIIFRFTSFVNSYFNQLE